MDSHFSSEETAFREEVRQFFAGAWTPELAELYLSDMRAATLEWHKRLNARGWLVPHWPKEHGGIDWTPTKQYIYDTERGLAGAPWALPFGISMLAPVIYTFGTEEQKQKFLPRIRNSEDWWCQGYSEPGSGSDLASLKTKAELDGDEYVVNGAKIWTSWAQHADWMFCL